MPKVGQVGALRVVVYPNDHQPAHVHVIGGGCEAVFTLNCPGGPPELRENFGFSLPALNRIEKALASQVSNLCDEWSAIHA